MNSFIKVLAKSRLLKGDLDYHLIRASMVLIYLLFGYERIRGRLLAEPDR